MRTAAWRVLGLVFVGLLLMSVVGLAASQTFINKTGKTVTGITITFSKDVRITRHDSAFPDQSPSGRAEEFTFSGRDLRNLGRFSITWMPSSAKVTDYEWIEKAQPAQATQSTSPSPEQEFSLPDPNTPPILYGDDYPSPDERLYQPQPDEQIWLTDLDEHGDIYDNDSIKINYAPGFDVSQITKIEVYRNGIKLRFLPETLDVLTNAQMKTFDGNPAEHSPASAHTDHAIMGYEYKFRILSADHVWMFSKTVKSGFAWRPKEVWANMGISWEWFRIDSIPFSDVVQFLEYLKADGFTGITMGIPYYISAPYDNDVFPVYDPYSENCWDEQSTPTNTELEIMLKAADAAGLDKRVMGFLYISQSYKDAHKDRYIGRGMMDPSNPKVFFENYTSLLEKMVPLLNKYHVKSLVVLDETGNLNTSYPEVIKGMLTKLSTEFNGRLGIDVGANNILQGLSWDEKKRTWKGTIGQMTFLGWTSPEGKKLEVLYSCHTPLLETQKDQRVSVMAPNFVKFWSPLFDYVAARYSNPPQGFGEIGAINADGQSLGVNLYCKIPPSQRIYDEQERADYILGAFKGSKALEIMTINVWGDFYNGDFAPRLDYSSISTGHYGYPASLMYRTIKAIVRPEE